MKLLPLAVFGTIVVAGIACWLALRKETSPPDGGATTESAGAPNVTGPPEQPSTSLPATQSRSKIEREQEIADWAKQRDAQVQIRQDELNYPGYVEVDSQRIALWPMPPRFLYQLQTAGPPLLLGERDDRHRCKREVCSVRKEGEKAEIFHGFTVTWPRFVKAGGLVFRRDEEKISRIGVIIPDVPIPPGGSQYDEPWAVNVRVEQKGAPLEDLFIEELKKFSSEQSTEDLIVLMAPDANTVPGRARILWFKIDEKGLFRKTNEWH